MKIKILYLLSTLERSGSTNVVYNLIKHLDRTRITPVVVTLSPEPQKSRKADFENLNVEVHTFSKSRLYWVLSDMRLFKEMIDQIKPDIIHSHTLRADVSSAKHLKNYRRISTIHSDMFANYKDTYNVIVGRLFANRQVWSIKQMDVSIACSKAVYEIYKDEIKNMICIQNGIDQEYFHQVDDKIKLRKELSLPLDKSIFISVGSLIGRKNPEVVIKAFLARNDSKSCLLVLGGGLLENTLKKNYGNNENIIFKGFTPNVTPYLQASDFFISASSSEGLPNTVMEALGCGLPVCLSDIPPHKEILELNPVAGRIFSLKSLSELTEAMNVLQKSNYSLLRQAAVGIVEKQLNARHMAQKYQDVYKNIVVVK